jgi:hypothetical protein
VLLRLTYSVQNTWLISTPAVIFFPEQKRRIISLLAAIFKGYIYYMSNLLAPTAWLEIFAKRAFGATPINCCHLLLLQAKLSK